MLFNKVCRTNLLLWFIGHDLIQAVISTRHSPSLYSIALPYWLFPPLSINKLLPIDPFWCILKVLPFSRQHSSPKFWRTIKSLSVLSPRLLFFSFIRLSAMHTAHALLVALWSLSGSSSIYSSSNFESPDSLDLQPSHVNLYSNARNLLFDRVIAPFLIQSPIARSIGVFGWRFFLTQPIFWPQPIF